MRIGWHMGIIGAVAGQRDDAISRDNPTIMCHEAQQDAQRPYENERASRDDIRRKYDGN